MKIGISGLGLIGGSFAKAIKAYTEHSVYGYDGSGPVMRSALETVLDCELGDETLPLCDLVIVCLYPSDTVDYIKAKAAQFKKGGLVIDACGVKCPICSQLEQVAGESGFTFIGAHPMAGTERTGFRHSFAELFQGASLIITPYADTPAEATGMLESFARSIGFANLQHATPERHDHMIAYTSQLAHVVSCAYVGSPSAPDFEGFSAGSFHDMTRVARLNERMWAELFIDNADYLSSEIEKIVTRLMEYSAAVRDKNFDVLYGLLRQAREIKQAIDPQDWE